MPWLSTTHDWSASVDADHLADIRRRPHALAPRQVELLTRWPSLAVEVVDERLRSFGRVPT